VQLRCTALTPEELAEPEYVLLAEMAHQSLAEFVIVYFLKRTSWLTRLHHLLSLATLIAIILIADSFKSSPIRSNGRWLRSRSPSPRSS
jgi:hypothetical protein